MSSVRIRSTVGQSPNDLVAIREIMLGKQGQSTLRKLSPVQPLRVPEKE